MTAIHDKKQKSRFYQPGFAQRATSFLTQIGFNVLEYDGGDAVFFQ